jgi:hypothetical protein
MSNALAKEGKEIEWFCKRDEGCGFFSTESNIDFYNRVLEFLKR